MYIFKESKYQNIIGSVICESSVVIDKPKIVSENNRRVLAEGTLQTADETNRNGRIYETAELFPQIVAPRTQELIKAGYQRAESGHPMSKDLARQQTIDPTNVCANFRKWWTQGKDVKGQFLGTNNALGEAFDLDLRDGYLPAWSLRALGSLEETKKGACVRNLKIITYDHVIYPSHPNAYTEKIVSEISESGMLLESGVYSRNSNVPNHTIQCLKESGKLVKNENGIYVPANVLAENSLVIPISNGSVIDYIKQESANFKLVKECFDLLYDSITLVNEGADIQMKDKNGNIFVVHIEQFIRNDLMNACTRRR